MIAEIMLASIANIFDTSSYSKGRFVPWLYQERSITGFYNSAWQSNTDTFFYDSRKLEKLGENYYILESFKKLKEGWDGYNGRTISERVIQRTEDLLLRTKSSPKVFPTGRGTIQVELFFDDDDLVEIEISGRKMDVYQVHDEEEIERTVSMKEAISILDSFVNGR